jgi:hypothetical protein
MILKPERGNPVGRVGNKRSPPPNDRYYVGFERKFYKIREFCKIQWMGIALYGKYPLGKAQTRQTHLAASYFKVKWGKHR